MEKAADNYDNGTYTDRPTGTYSGDAVTEWVFNEERQEGDLTLIESGDNYYVVLFHSRGRNDYNTVDVRHILFRVDTSDLDSKADDYQEKLDARKAEQKEAAEAALKKWEEGARTEDSFAELANELSADTGSNTKGGLYTEVYKGQMVTEFNDWCFDESRQPGDTGIVYNEGSYTGYHVIYFVGTDAPLLAGAGPQRHEERRLHPVEQRSREGHHRHRGLRYEVPRLMNFRKRPYVAGLF